MVQSGGTPARASQYASKRRSLYEVLTIRTIPDDMIESGLADNCRYQWASIGAEIATDLRIRRPRAAEINPHKPLLRLAPLVLPMFARRLCFA
jgi:hypothetical protein